MHQLRDEYNIPIEDLVKTVIAAEAPGWKLGFACKGKGDPSIATMYQTDDMADTVKGLAIPFNSSMIKALDK